MIMSLKEKSLYNRIHDENIFILSHISAARQSHINFYMCPGSSHTPSQTLLTTLLHVHSGVILDTLHTSTDYEISCMKKQLKSV